MKAIAFIIFALLTLSCGKSVRQRGSIATAKIETGEGNQIGVKPEVGETPTVTVETPTVTVEEEETLQEKCEKLGFTWDNGVCIKMIPGGGDEPDLPPYFTSTPLLEHSFYTDAGESITLTAKVRDFKKDHLDFERFAGKKATQGLVHATLGNDGNPIFIGTPGVMMTSAATFAQWFNDVPGVNLTTEVPLKLSKKPDSANVYWLDNPEFFPIDNALHGNEGLNHNFHFTVRLETNFTYTGGEVFTFTGDDDVWVFINHKLAVDLGGVHHADTGSVALDSLGLVKGKDYSFVMFFAERHTGYSRFRVETSLQLRSNTPYQYDAIAVDPEGAAITYSLVSGPAGLTINPKTGVLLWPPDKLLMGNHPVIIKASDATGGEVLQQYALKVAAGL